MDAKKLPPIRAFDWSTLKGRVDFSVSSFRCGHYCRNARRWRKERPNDLSWDTRLPLDVRVKHVRKELHRTLKWKGLNTLLLNKHERWALSMGGVRLWLHWRELMLRSRYHYPMSEEVKRKLKEKRVEKHADAVAELKAGYAPVIAAYRDEMKTNPDLSSKKTIADGWLLQLKWATTPAQVERIWKQLTGIFGHLSLNVNHNHRVEMLAGNELTLAMQEQQARLSSRGLDMKESSFPEVIEGEVEDGD